MKTLTVIFLLIVLSAYIVLCIFMYFYQGKLLFFPQSSDTSHYKKLWADTHLENIVLSTSDGYILDGWREKSSEKKYTILYFWGNAEETSDFVENTNYTGANIISFNYRWYGRSTGIPSEKALFADALLEYDHLVGNMNMSPENIIVMGRSLGAGVATYLASERTVAKVILVTPYDSIESIAKESYPLLPVSFLLRNKFDSVVYAAIRSNRLLSISAGKDTTIPNHHTENLLKYWNGSQKKIFIPEATHEDILDRVELIEGIDRFISEP